jgi:hypothetical protein
MAADLGSCLCGCGRTYRRPKSMPLCKPASTRAWAVCRSLYGDADLCEQGRINARFWVDPETVRAALNGDLAKVQQRVAYRDEHGLYADPDRALAGAGR